MSKLSPADAIFLWAETPEMTNHVAGLQIFRLPEGKGTDWLYELMSELRTYEPGPPFNQRLNFRLGRTPELVEDKEFDIDYHLRHTVLPKPGSDKELRNLVARLHSHLMDRDRPLWEFHLIEGLEGGRFAIYLKIHHAICDGATFSKWMAESTVADPEANTPPPWSRPRRYKNHDRKSWRESIFNPIQFLEDTSDVGKGLLEIANRLFKKRFVELDDDIALPLSGPRTALNAEVAASRNVDFTSFSVDELKAMGRPFGATLNDVVLAICDLTLSRYLEEQGEPVNSRLIAAVPVNLRLPGDTREGNLVTSLQIKLGKRDMSPEQRIEKISQTVQKAKELYEGIPAASTQIYTYSTVILASLGQSLQLTGIVPPPLNLIVSNVPGPRETRYFAGARLEETYPVSGIAPMTALNVTLYSYDGTLFVGLTASRRTVRYLEDMKECMDEVYSEFRDTLLPKVKPRKEPDKEAAS